MIDQILDSIDRLQDDISELEEEIKDLKAFKEIAFDGDDVEDEIQELEWAIADKEGEIETLEDTLQDFQYSGGDEMVLNGVSYSQWI